MRWYIVFFNKKTGKAFGSSSFKDFWEAQDRFDKYQSFTDEDTSYVFCDESIYDVIRGIE